MRDTNLSKVAQCIIKMHNKGYHLLKDGTLVGLSGNPVRGGVNARGYRTFNFRYDGSCYGLPIHRLQAYQKYGKKALLPGTEVRHLDGDPLNNAWENILIGTRSDNVNDIPEHIRHKSATKAGRSNSKLKESDVREIRRLREQEGWTYRKLLKKFDISKSALSYICNYTTWKDV